MYVFQTRLKKEMEVDQPDAPILTSTTVSPAAGSEPRKLPDPAPTAGSATIVPDASPVVFQPGSGSGTGTDEQVKEPVPGASNSFYNVDPNSKLGKAILQSKFKIPDIPKSSSSEKVPTGVKDPGPKKIVNPIPAEADAVPSKTYMSIISSKMLKGKVGTIGGITSGQGVSECGSFFNKGDNRVLRSVYKEDISTMSVSSLSFNPVKWVCSSCPSSHPVFGEGGGYQQDCYSFGRPKLPRCAAIL